MSTSAETNLNDVVPNVNGDSHQCVLLVNLTNYENHSQLLPFIVDKNKSNYFEIDNKYYTAKIECKFHKCNLVPETKSDNLDQEDKLAKVNKNEIDYNDCHAIIIFVESDEKSKQKLTSCLTNLPQIHDGPRIVVQFSPVVENKSHGEIKSKNYGSENGNSDDDDDDDELSHDDTLQQWCAENKFESILMPTPLDNFNDKITNEKLKKARSRLVDSLSSYKWPFMTMKTKDKLSEETMKKLEEFDDLLNQINSFRETQQQRQKGTNTTASDKTNGKPAFVEYEEMLTKIGERIASIMGEDYDPNDTGDDSDDDLDVADKGVSASK